MSRESRQSSARRPRGVVKINDKNASFVSFKVENKTHFSADTWTVELDLFQQPQGFDYKFFAQSEYTTVEVLMGALDGRQPVGALPASPTSLIIGQLDDIEEDWNAGKLTLTGRDYTARFIDLKTANRYPDHVSSWIATELARQVGLTAQVTPTTTPSGEYYQNSYSTLTRSTPMWDLITFLAEQEGFDAYVKGTSLYFGPPEADSNANPFDVLVQRQGNSIVSTARKVLFHRSETVAKDVSVTVLSHGYAKGRGVKAVANRAGSKPANSTASNSKSNTQSYVIRRPNLTQDQAQQLANQTLLDITRHERGADLECEGDVTMNVRRRVNVHGTGTSFDQSYYVTSLSHAFSMSAGHDMSMVLKNHPTLSETSAV